MNNNFTLSRNEGLTRHNKSDIIYCSKIIRSKSAIRKRILKKLKSQKEESRTNKSFLIKKKLFRLGCFKRAKKVLLYFGKGYEVDTLPIIKEALKKGKRVFLPVTDTKRKRLIISEISDIEKDTSLGCFGIYEPKRRRLKTARPETIDLMVVPGVAFDRHKNRIGHGAGYYDRFLKSVPRRIPSVGLAFDFQVLGAGLPTLSYDIAVTRVVTN